MIMSAKFSTLRCALYLILCINVQFINATQEVPAAEGKTLDYTSHARLMHLFQETFWDSVLSLMSWRV